jgi:hypothetical protein
MSRLSNKLCTYVINVTNNLKNRRILQKISNTSSVDPSVQPNGFNLTDRRSPKRKRSETTKKSKHNTPILTGTGERMSNEPKFTTEEIENSKRIFKSATPKYTADWYIKWVSSIIVLVAMSIRGVEGLQFYDLSLSIVGIFGWLIVSLIWKDRALILLNSIGLLLLMRNLIEYIYN